MTDDRNLDIVDDGEPTRYLSKGEIQGEDGYLALKGRDFIRYRMTQGPCGPVLHLEAEDYRSMDRFFPSSCAKGDLGVEIAMAFLTANLILPKKMPNKCPYDLELPCGVRLEVKCSTIAPKGSWQFRLSGGTESQESHLVGSSGAAFSRDYGSICDAMICVGLHGDGSTDIFIIPSDSEVLGTNEANINILEEWRSSPRMAPFHVSNYGRESGPGFTHCTHNAEALARMRAEQLALERLRLEAYADRRLSELQRRAEGTLE